MEEISARMREKEREREKERKREREKEREKERECVKAANWECACNYFTERRRDSQ